MTHNLDEIRDAAQVATAAIPGHWHDDSGWCMT